MQLTLANLLCKSQQNSFPTHEDDEYVNDDCKKYFGRADTLES